MMPHSLIKAVSRDDHHITRITHHSTPHWLVRVMRQGVVTTGVFSDGVYGSELAALYAAREYRDQLLNALYDPGYRLWRRSVELKNNTSGHPGVGRHTIRKRKQNGLIETHYWVAYWTDANGRIKSRRFSIKKYGEVKAKALACAARVEALAQLVG